MKHTHIHVHGDLAEVFATEDAEQTYKRDREGKFSTSSGTGEQHAATSEIHTAHAERKGTDHKDYPHHVAAAEAHKKAAAFLSQANKAQHPGAAIEAERHAKAARLHENTINKGRGSDPAGEVARQNKAMSDPRVMKENRERNAELDKKHPAKGAKKSKTKDEAPCGCGGTADAGFDESKHPRDHGKFSTMGHAGGSVDHHITRQEYHEKQQSASQFGDKRQAHAMAAQHHQKAAHHLATAYSHHALGDKEGADKQHMLAQHHANQASRHEGTSGFPSPLKDDGAVGAGVDELRVANALATSLHGATAHLEPKARAKLARSEAARIRANGHHLAASMLETTAAGLE